MSDLLEIEVVRKIYDNSEGVFVEIGPDADGLGNVRIRTTEAKSVEWFGKFDFSFSPGMARLIAKAMTLAADEIEARS